MCTHHRSSARYVHTPFAWQEEGFELISAGEERRRHAVGQPCCRHPDMIGQPRRHRRRDPAPAPERPAPARRYQGDQSGQPTRFRDRTAAAVRLARYPRGQGRAMDEGRRAERAVWREARARSARDAHPGPAARAGGQLERRHANAWHMPDGRPLGNADLWAQRRGPTPTLHDRPRSGTGRLHQPRHARRATHAGGRYVVHLTATRGVGSPAP